MHSTLKYSVHFNTISILEIFLQIKNKICFFSLNLPSWIVFWFECKCPMFLFLFFFFLFFSYVLLELVETERDYVRDLGAVVEVGLYSVLLTNVAVRSLW